MIGHIIYNVGFAVFFLGFCGNSHPGSLGKIVRSAFLCGNLKLSARVYVLPDLRNGHRPCLGKRNASVHREDSLDGCRFVFHRIILDHQIVALCLGNAVQRPGHLAVAREIQSLPTVVGRLVRNGVGLRICRRGRAVLQPKDSVNAGDRDFFRGSRHVGVFPYVLVVRNRIQQLPDVACRDIGGGRRAFLRPNHEDAAAECQKHSQDKRCRFQKFRVFHSQFFLLQIEF